jgi:DNA polymerase IIIc chi subunit
MIAIVGNDPGQEEAARLRWREYARAGHQMKHVPPAEGAGES